MDGPNGVIASEWKRKDGRIAYAFTIPPNTTAEIVLPGEAPLKVGSGSYRFDRPCAK